jgi:phenylpropionate dioxygenase-like ring-hydroxylating dioxygenase large terminal subunit
VQGNIWVYFGDKTDKLPDVPRAPRLDDGYFASTFTSFVVPNHFDYNALALLEPSHVPYVHKQWWWSRSGKSIKEKAKTFVPCETGWTMVQHKRPQQSFLLKLLGSEIDTEIGFRLPAYRLEHIVVGGKAVLSGMTILTPVDENSTEFIHITYWTAPLARFIAPLVRPFMDYCVSKFVGQDREMAIKQAKGLRFRPNLILNIKDSGTAGKWYFQLKDEWTEAHEQGRPFINPIKETILRWRT